MHKSFVGRALLVLSLPVISSLSWGAQNCGPPPMWNLDEFELSLTRDECYGECPSYTVTVNGDGHVTYRGRTYVAVTGERTDQVDNETVRTLVERVYESRFFDCSGDYNVEFGNDGVVVAFRPPRTLPTDVPSVALQVTIGDFEKKEWYAPTEQDDVFWKLARAIDDLLDTKRWVK